MQSPNKQENKKGKDKQTNPQVIFMWEAPIRAYKKRSTGVLRFYIALAVLLTFIAYLFNEIILILPIWATIFLVYVLTITPPGRIKNQITHFGIASADNTYRWEHLSHFYFIKKFDYWVLTIVAAPPYYGHVYLVVENNDIKGFLIKILSDYIIFQEKPKKTFTDKLAEWLTKLMPDDEEAPR